MDLGGQGRPGCHPKSNHSQWHLRPAQKMEPRCHPNSNHPEWHAQEMEVEGPSEEDGIHLEWHLQHVGELVEEEGEREEQEGIHWEEQEWHPEYVQDLKEVEDKEEEPSEEGIHLSAPSYGPSPESVGESRSQQSTFE